MRISRSSLRTLDVVDFNSKERAGHLYFITPGDDSKYQIGNLSPTKTYSETTLFHGALDATPDGHEFYNVAVVRPWELEVPTTESGEFERVPVGFFAGERKPNSKKEISSLVFFPSRGGKLRSWVDDLLSSTDVYRVSLEPVRQEKPAGKGNLLSAYVHVLMPNEFSEWNVPMQYSLSASPMCPTGIVFQPAEVNGAHLMRPGFVVPVENPLPLKQGFDERGVSYVFDDRVVKYSGFSLDPAFDAENARQLMGFYAKLLNGPVTRRETQRETQRVKCP